jgi:hypothetical protein
MVKSGSLRFATMTTTRRTVLAGPVIMIGLLSVALPATHATSTVDLAGFALLACDFRVC